MLSFLLRLVRGITKMKVIIAGSRDIVDPHVVDDAVRESGFEVTEVVSGGARGIDRMGELWGAKHGIPVKVFRADWEKHGKSAGVRRNREMAEYAEACIAIWNGSRGTANMIDEAGMHNLKLFIKKVDFIGGLY